MFNNCSVKESNMAEENKFERIQQLAAQIATISDDIDDHIDENPVEDICSSFEDLDVIITPENLRTQYRSEHQEMRISPGNQYKEKYEASYEKKTSIDQGIYQGSKRCKKKHASPRIFTERTTEAKAIKVVRFLLKIHCGHDGQFKNRICKVI